MGHFDDRLDGRDAVPPGADPVLRVLWAEPWWVWRVEAEADGTGELPSSTVLTTPRRGSYRVGLVDDPSTGQDRVMLWPVESSFLHGTLEDLIQAAHFGREPRLR